jgi:hypothetical protein
MNLIDTETRILVERLVTEFSFLIDHGQAIDVPALFTEDGSFESPIATLNGRKAIASAMAQRMQADYMTRHVTSNLRLQRESANQILGTVLLTMYRWTPGDLDAKPNPIALLEYEDVYRRCIDSEWRFAARKALPVLPAAKK